VARGYRRTISIDFDTSQVKKGAKDVNAAMRALDSDFRKSSEEVRKYGRETDGLALQKEVLTKKIELQTGRIEELQKEYNTAKDTLGEYNKRTMQKKTELNNATVALDKMKDQLARTTNELKNKETALGRAISKIDDLKRSAQEAGVDVDKLAGNFVKTGAVLTGIGAIAGTMAMTFDDAMAKISLRADTSVYSMDELRNMVLNVASAYTISAGEVANAAFSMLDSNLATEDLAQGLSNAATLARVGFTDMGTSQRTLMRYTNLFNLSIEEQSKLVDQMAVAMDRGDLSLVDLYNSLDRVALSLNRAGVSHEEYLAALTTMTAQGISARDAQRALMRALDEMANPSTKITELAEEMGFSFNRNINASRGFTGTLEVLNRVANSSSGALDDLFKNCQAIGAVFALTGESAEAFRGNLDAIGNASGIADEQLSKLESTAGADMRAALNDLQINLIRAGDAFQPVISIVASFISAIAGMPTGVIVAVSAFGALLIVLGTFIKLVNQLKTVQQGYLTIKAALNAILGRNAAANKAATASTAALTKSQISAALANATLTKTQAQALLMSGKLSKAQTIQALKSGTLAKADIKAAVASGALSKAKAGAILKNAGLLKSNAALAASNKAVAASAKVVGFSFKLMKKPLIIIGAVVAGLIALFTILGLISRNSRQEADRAVGQMNANVANAQRQGAQANQAGATTASTQIASIAPMVESLPRYARGTTNHPGGRAWVGEEGPEIVDLPAGSRVYTAAQSRKMTQDNNGQMVYVDKLILQVDMDEVGEVYRLIDIVRDFAHNKIVYGGV